MLSNVNELRIKHKLFTVFLSWQATKSKKLLPYDSIKNILIYWLLFSFKAVNFKSFFIDTRLFYSSNQTADYPRDVINYAQLKAHELEKVNHNLKEKLLSLIGYVSAMSIELSVLQAKRAEDIIAAQKEITKRSDDLIAGQREIACLNLRIKDIGIDLKDSNNSYLIAKSCYKVRGALEYCRAYLASKKKIAYHFSEPFVQTLKRLEEDKEFLEEVEKRWHSPKVDIGTVKKCLFQTMNSIEMNQTCNVLVETLFVILVP